MPTPESALWFKGFSALDHKIRFKILPILLHNSPRSANEVRIKLGANEAVFAHHISILENAGLVDCSKTKDYYHITDDGKHILSELGVHSVADDSTSSIREITATAFEKLKSFKETAFGPRGKWVTVLGAFDTWPYMDHVSTILATFGFTAFTSRYNYRKIGTDLHEHSVDPDPSVLMGKFLQKMITKSNRDVIIFSVSAGHYIEADWCYQLGKPTLGIAFVREAIPEKKFCEDLVVHYNPRYSWCGCVRGGTSWNCLDKSECPFKKQGISYNVIEYFLRRKNMTLAAVNKMSSLEYLLKDWLSGTLKERLG